MGTVAPRKSSGGFLGKRIMAFMREVGCELGQVVVKTDNEPALGAVVDEVGRLRAAKGAAGMVWRIVRWEAASRMELWNERCNRSRGWSGQCGVL